MHLKVSHNVKTLLSEETLPHSGSHPIRMHCTCYCSAPPILDHIKLLKGFEAMSMCGVETQPVEQEALKAAFAKPNGLIMFPV